MYKNLTIRQLTFYVTAIITLINGAMFMVLYSYISDFKITVPEILILSSGALLNFFFIAILLERVVFRKIKIIYKMIKAQKLTRDEKTQIDAGITAISKVSDDVEEWAKNTTDEIKYLKSLEKYRKDYVGNISHELKTPIFSIQGYLHTLVEGGLYDNRVNMSYLKRAISNVDRLRNIVDDLEIISRLESEETIVAPEKFDLKALVKEVIDDCEMMATGKQIKILFKEGASQSYNVSADREMIRQVMNNLVVNAIKYGKEDGKITISFYDLEGTILTEVSDDGIGIEEQHLKHLFDRFYRVESSRSRKIGGSGLGLSIVKHIIEAHEQNLNVRSTPGIGTTFGFTLNKA
ncbi:MAG: sensor histidine kinase [Saprospiraceae bacterium]|nr:sensor histidine kinase [Saprospiraceae bacterium]